MSVRSRVSHVAVCANMLHVAVCVSVLQCVTVCCSVCCGMLQSRVRQVSEIKSQVGQEVATNLPRMSKLTSSTSITPQETVNKGLFADGGARNGT